MRNIKDLFKNNFCWEGKQNVCRTFLIVQPQLPSKMWFYNFVGTSHQTALQKVGHGQVHGKEGKRRNERRDQGTYGQNFKYKKCLRELWEGFIMFLWKKYV